MSGGGLCLGEVCVWVRFVFICLYLHDECPVCAQQQTVLGTVPGVLLPGPLVH